MTEPDEESSAPLSERTVCRGMRVNIVAGSLGMVWVAAAFGIPLTMFMEALGASGVLIGLTATVQQLSMVLQIPSALLAERLPRRKPYWGALTLVQRLIWFLPAALPLVFAHAPGRMAGLTLGIVALSAVLANSTAAAWWSWMADLIPEKSRGSFWGRRQSLVTAVHLVAVWFLGWILDVFPDPRTPGGSYAGFMLVFAIAAVFGSADIITHFWVPEPTPVRARGGGRLWTLILAPLRARDFARATLALGVWTFGVGLVGQFTILHLKRDFGVTYTQLAATTISASLGVALCGVFWGYVMDRIGARNLGVMAMLVAPVCGLAWFFMREGTVTIVLPRMAPLVIPQAVAVLTPVNLFAGAFYSAVGLSQVGLIAGLAPTERRTLAMAVHWSVIGLMAAAGPLVGGVVMDAFDHVAVPWRLPTGAPFVFVHVLVMAHMLITWLVAAPILLTVSRRPGELGVRAAFSRLLVVGNPLRAVSIMYNLSAMSVAVTSRWRARALRRRSNGDA